MPPYDFSSGGSARLILYFAFGLAGSILLTPLCRYLAHQFGYVAKPKEDRWHSKPTALLGGIAIVVPSLVIGVAVGPDANMWRLLGCFAAIAAVGLADDLLSLKPSTKLISQIAVASALLFFGYRLHWTNSLIFDSMFTLFWIVGITNALNLLDNMDGLCAGTALIAGIFLAVGAYRGTGANPEVTYLAVMLGATAGFLIYNVNPASIFMGDTGSLFLGLNLAALTLVSPLGPQTSGVISVVAGPVLLLLIPILDTSLVTVVRILSGRKPSQGGRDHSSHRLVALGLPERTAVAVLWGLAACAGAIGLLLQQLDDANWDLGVIVAVGFLLAMTIFAVFLARIRVYTESEVGSLPRSGVTPLLIEVMYKRRIAEIVLDLCLIPLAYYCAYRLRFEGTVRAINNQYFIESLPVVLATQVLSNFAVGAYRGTWRYFGMMDAVVLVRGVVIGTVTSVMIVLYISHFESYSRAVFVIYAALLTLLLIGTRASFRLLAEFFHRRLPHGQRCVIYGTSGASVSIVREAFAHQPLKIVGFVDDDPMHANMRVAGYSVVGDFARLLAMVERREIDCVIVNQRLADVDRLQELEAACRDREIELLTLQLGVKRFTMAS
jgi:UDP-GlcNAc:undecaprenyl-phosphate GlcNAc-1-phosphate transferase